MFSIFMYLFLSPSHPLSRLCFLLVPFILLQLPQFSSDGGWKSRPPLSYQPKPRANWEVRQREAFSAKHEPSTFSTSSMLFSFVSPLSSPFPLHMSLSHSSQTFAHTTLSSKKACPVSLHKSTLQVKKKKKKNTAQFLLFFSKHSMTKRAGHSTLNLRGTHCPEQVLYSFNRVYLSIYYILNTMLNPVQQHIF